MRLRVVYSAAQTDNSYIVVVAEGFSKCDKLFEPMQSDKINFEISLCYLIAENLVQMQNRVASLQTFASL